MLFFGSTLCAKKHFAAISNGSVVYSVVDNYSTLMQLVSN